MVAEVTIARVEELLEPPHQASNGHLLELDRFPGSGWYHVERHMIPLEAETPAAAADMLDAHFRTKLDGTGLQIESIAILRGRAEAEALDRLETMGAARQAVREGHAIISCEDV